MGMSSYLNEQQWLKKTVNDYTVFFIRNHFIRHLVLDSLKFKKLLELQGKS